MKRPPLGRRALRCALGAVLACGLVPSAALAVPAASDLMAAMTRTASDEGEDAQAAVPGQAIVLYRASDAASVRLLDSANADEFASAGFEVAQEWDFSAVDRALDQGVVRLQSDEGGSGAVPSGADLRVALVEREGADVDDLVAELEALDFVVAAQPNYVVTLDGVTPDDTLYDGWQYNMTSEDAGIDLEAALAARDEAPAPAENVVAVIDTGVDVSHPDLVDHMWKNPGIEGLPGEAGSCGYDFGGNDDDPTPGATTLASHGTHCAGVVAGVQNNGEGVAGASSDTKVMALRVDTDAVPGIFYTNNIVSAYEYLIGAALSGEHVVAVNNSWSSGSYLPVFDYLVNQAGRFGILSVFAAGNDSRDTNDAESSMTIGLESPYAVVVASSNKVNALSTFSNYNETDVDLALPGSNIMSTVSTDAAHAYFSPSVSLASGEDLEYVNDFSDYSMDSDAYQTVIYDADGNPVSPDVEDAFTVERVSDAGHGLPGLRVTFDPSRADGSVMYTVRITWSVDNPFVGTTHVAQDYAIGAGGVLDPTSPANTLAYVTPGLAVMQGDERVMLQDPLSYAQYVVDQSAIGGTSLVAIDTESEQLTGWFWLDLMTLDGAPLDGKVTFCVEPYGIGLVDGEGVDDETSDYAPYGEMSGTSMSAPMAAGTIGQLAALHPEESALELRGRLVGSTVPLSTTTYGGVEKHTATDGRFDWNVALDDDAVSANTWLVDADPATGTLTVHGYALGDASVALDGEAVPCAEQDDGELTFVAPADVFDGKEHRIDVTDRSTGRTHRASYGLPALDASFDLARTDDLPGDEAEQATGVLVSAGDALYFADTRGAYLYRSDRPGSGAWTACAAPEGLWYEGDTDARSSIAYAFVGDDLVATTADVTDEGDVVAFSATYNAEKDEWGPYRSIDGVAAPERIDGAPAVRTRENTMTVVGATTIDDTAYALVGAALYGDETGIVGTSYTLVSQDGVDGGLSATVLQIEQLQGIYFLPSTPVAHDGAIYALGSILGACDPSATYELHAYVIDPVSGAVEDRGVIEGAASCTLDELQDLDKVALVPFEDGALLFSVSLEGARDTLYIDFETLSIPTSAWIGASGATGVVATSAATHDGTIYLSALDRVGDAGSASAALYTLPYAAVEQLSGEPCPTEGFSDVDGLAWYHEAVDWAVENGVLNGYGEGGESLGPVADVTRAEMAQMLWNRAGRPEAEADLSAFTDVDAGGWYAPALEWCVLEGIFSGYGDTFGTERTISREEAATVLWRLAGSPEADADLSGYGDASSVSDYAAGAIEWAVANGVLTGKGGVALDPQAGCTRGEVAAMMMRMAK